MKWDTLWKFAVWPLPEKTSWKAIIWGVILCFVIGLIIGLIFGGVSKYFELKSSKPASQPSQIEEKE